VKRIAQNRCPASGDREGEPSQRNRKTYVCAIVLGRRTKVLNIPENAILEMSMIEVVVIECRHLEGAQTLGAKTFDIGPHRWNECIRQDVYSSIAVKMPAGRAPRPAFARHIFWRRKAGQCPEKLAFDGGSQCPRTALSIIVFKSWYCGAGIAFVANCQDNTRLTGALGRETASFLIQG